MAILLICLAGGQMARAQATQPTQQGQPDQSTPGKADQSAAPNAEPNAEPNNKDAEPENPANPPSLLTPLKPQKQDSPYSPVTPRQRLRWFITNTIGPPHLVGGLFTSAFGTAVDRPKEYGPSWGGFGDRFGMRLTGITTSNAMEAGIGSLWEEDPRYFRIPDEPFKSRLRNVVKQTFRARRNDGSFGPAYARFVAVTGSNFLSNTWRVESESNTHDALIRTFEGFAGRMAANAYEEFWPDLKQRAFRHSE